MNTIVTVNTLYYSFSTISQTLAGTLGVLTAVVLFRQQQLNKIIQVDYERLINVGRCEATGDLERFKDYCIRGNWYWAVSVAKKLAGHWDAELKKEQHETNNQNIGKRDFMSDERGLLLFLSINLNQLSTLNRSLKLCLKITIPVLLSSVLFLNISEALINNIGFTIFILTTTFIGFVMSVLTFLNLIYKCLNLEKIENYYPFGTK